MLPGRPLSALPRVAFTVARMPADLLTWPLRAAGELWWVRTQLPRIRAMAAESVRLAIEADGDDRPR